LGVALVEWRAVRLAYRALAGAVCAFSVGIQYWFFVRGLSGAALVADTVKFLSYFTILTNILAAAALLLPLAAPQSSPARFLSRPSVRTAIAGYIIVVGVVYYLLLRNLGDAEGWPLFFERGLHYLTPPLFVLDWLLFVPKGRVVWWNGVACLGFPALYAVWTLVNGALTGWYPYPFMDVGDLGYPSVLANIAGLVVAFLLLDLALVGIDRWLGHKRHNAAQS
jgi:hypothetical protein